MAKSAKEAGELLRKISKSPYWQEVWVTKKDLDELPKMIAKEANLSETMRDFNRDVNKSTSSVKTAINEIFKDDQPKTMLDLKSLPSENSIQPESRSEKTDNTPIDSSIHGQP
jgi:hypothetical protein